MAVTLPGTGADVATDLVGGAEYQLFKLMLGAAGAAADLTPTNPLPVGGPAAHDAAVGSTNPLLLGGRAQAAAPTAVSTDGDMVRAWFQLNGAFMTEVTAAGARIGGDATNGLDVDVTRLPGQVTEDVASAGGEVSLLMAAVRRDAASSGVNTDGDFANLAVDASGRLHVNVGALIALPAGTNNIGDVDVLTLPGAIGSIADDSAASGTNPMLVGLEARTSNRTAVSSGDLVRALADTLGKQVMLVGATHDLDVEGRANLTGTGASTIIAANASARTVVTNIVVINHSTSAAAKVSIRRGTTVLMVIPAGVNGGGAVVSNPRGITKTATNETVEAISSVAADIEVFVSGYQINN